MRRGIVAAIMVMLTAMLTLSVPTAVAAPSTTDTGCAPVAIVPIRGSGEKQQTSHRYSSTVTSTWEGEVLRRLLKRLYTDHPDLASTPIVEVGAAYPAVAVNDVLAQELTTGYLTSSPIYKSARKGTEAAIRAMAEFQVRGGLPGMHGCESTRFILVGYSQGAMAARDVANSLPSLVSSVVLYGDPWQKGGADGVTGTGSAGNGVFRTNYPLAGSDQYYRDTAFDRHSLCHAKDVICAIDPGAAWNALGNDVATHVNYFNDAAEAKAEAKILADAVRRARSTPPEVPSTPRGDVSIVIDTTGSMSPYIADAKRNAEAIARRVIGRGNGSRVSLVEYRDHGDGFVARTVVSSTTDVVAFTAGVSGLSAGGGGDIPEAVYSGLIEGLHSFDSPPATRRSIIVIGDAPPHDPEPVTGHTRAQLLRYLTGADALPRRTSATTLRAAPTTDPASRAQSPAKRSAQRPAATEQRQPAADPTTLAPSDAGSPSGVSLYTLSADQALTDALGPVSAATGGKVFDISAADKVSDAIFAAIDYASSAPTAVLGAPSPVVAGDGTPITAVASNGSDLTYEFDLDGDGVYETRSTDGTVIHQFKAAGKATVGLRVTDKDGRAAIATMSIDVVAATAIPNERPKQTGAGSSEPGTGSLGGVPTRRR